MWSAVEAEARAGNDPVDVLLCDTTIVVPPLWQWPRDGLLALLADEHEVWAQLCLTAREYDRWRDCDPTLDDCDDAVADWESQSGQDLDTIGRLWHVVGRWPDELEADLAGYCGGQDLRHLWQPCHGPSRLTWRRLGVLYDGLPGQSLTKTAQANALGDAKLAELAKKARDGHGPWSHTDMLLADLIDAVNANTYILRLANTPKERQKSVKPAEPIHRPGLVRKRGRGRTTLAPEARELLAYMAANHGALPPGQWKDVPALPATQP